VLIIIIIIIIGHFGDDFTGRMTQPTQTSSTPRSKWPILADN